MRRGGFRYTARVARKKNRRNQDHSEATSSPPAGKADADAGPSSDSASEGRSGTVGGAGGPWAERLHLAALGLAIVVTAARLTMSEDWTAEPGREGNVSGTAMTAGEVLLAQPAPGTGPALAWLGLVAGVLWLASAALRGSLTVAAVPGWAGLAMLAAGAMQAIPVAPHAFAARTAGTLWIGQIGLAALLVQLLRTRAEVRWLAVVLVAAVVLGAGKGLWQVGVEFPDVRRYYESQALVQSVPMRTAWSLAAAEARRAGETVAADELPEELDSPGRHWFEDRLDKGRATGWMVHANVFGSVLGLALLTAWGLRRDNDTRAREGMHRVSRAVGAVMLPVLAGALVLTGSRGAMAATALAFAGWAAVSAVPEWFARNRRLVVRGAAGAVAAGIVGVIVIGATSGTLPGRTMAYRWEYWSATADLLTARRPGPSPDQKGLPLWVRGLGPAQFGPHYGAVQPESAIESVRSPHCVPLQAVAEFGILGGLGVLALAVGLVRRADRLAAEPSATPARDATPSASPRGRPAPAGADTGPDATGKPNPESSAAGSRSASSREEGAGAARGAPPAATKSLTLLSAGTALGTAVIWAWAGAPDLLLLLAAIALPAMVLTGLLAAVHGEPDHPTAPVSDAPLEATRRGLGWGMFAFGIHGLIDLNLFWPAGLAAFTAAFAAWAALGNLAGGGSGRVRVLQWPRPLGWGLTAGAAVLAVVVLVRVVLPTTRVESAVREARDLMDSATSPAEVEAARRLLVGAIDIDPANPAPWEAMLDLGLRQFRSVRAQLAHLRAGRFVEPGKDVSAVQAQFRRVALGLLSELDHSLEALKRLLPADPQPRAARVGVYRMAAQLVIEEPSLVAPSVVPMLPGFEGAVHDLRTLQAAAIQWRLFRQVQLEAAGEVRTMRRADVRALLELARAGEGIRPSERLLPVYQEVRRLSAARSAAHPGEGLPAPLLREVEAAIRRHGGT